MVKSIFKRVARKVLGDPVSDYILYSRNCYHILRKSGLPTGKAEGEDEYRRRWKKMSPLVDPYIYRLFIHYCGPTPDIIPEDILHRLIERRLNPYKYWHVYEDKNMFPFVIGPENVPVTVLARVQGGLVRGRDLQPVANAQNAIDDCPFPALILKPSVGTSCGIRVMKFYRNGNVYISTTGVTLTLDFLHDFGSDWILQEAIEQHPFTARNCASATNSMRIVVYRSVVDEQPHVTSAYFRFGGQGAVVDNAHAGGRYMAIDIPTGRLAENMFDEFGNRYPFPDAGCIMPSWDAAVELSCHVARCIPHHHLFALDVAIDKNGKPMLLEYNIGGFSSHAGYHVGQTVFGPYLPEVIDYCSRR